MLQTHRLGDPEQALTQSIEQAFLEYESSSQFFFQYLKMSSEKGLNRKQFEIYRDNFFFRTSSTPKSIFRLVRAAMLRSDLETCQTAAENLLDELGQGNLKHSHSKLLETAYNFHGQKIFSLPEIKIVNVDSSTLICQEAIDFRSTQKSLYENQAYLVILGCSFAQESAAEPMLQIFYKTLFEPYRVLYTDQEFKRVSRYFTAHINGLEAHHAKQARQTLVRNCHTSRDLALIMQGVTGFLRIQAALWNGILREMQNASKNV